MVTLRGPLMQLEAHGWLGGDMYGHRQYRNGSWVEPKRLVRNPYPISFLPFFYSGYSYPAFGFRPCPGFIGQYYSRLGWCYQLRRTWHGITWAAIHPPISANPKKAAQVVCQTKFAQAVVAWQALTGLEKGVWNSYNYPRHPSGYNRFIRAYMRDLLY